MPIALATSAALPDLDSDNQRLLQALKNAGVDARPVVWDDPSVDWGAFALCVIRSTWDYVPKRDQYMAWAERVASQTVLCNPAPVIRWNTDKTYLQDLERQGVVIVETFWLSAGAAIDWRALMEAHGWREMVVKPVVSASGKDTVRVSLESLTARESELSALLAHRDLMVQPFMASITTVGELSFLFFDGRFSHAVAKKPASNEFRVQEHLGGRTGSLEPTPMQRDFAESVMRAVAWPTLYARVDVMLDEAGQLRLSELELTEPSMYLEHHPEAAQRFARAVQRQRIGVLK
jgi:glutathione synthase/RimK-type ligase-like ATP-grasp enzyme